MSFFLECALCSYRDFIQVTSNKRYAEPSSLAVRSGTEITQDASADDLVDLEGHLDVDLAELSLGQRLTALDPSAPRPATEADHSDSDSPEHPSTRTAPVAQPNSITLTRTLIQALHSADTKLLETCLAYSDAALITQTVQRLPPQLAVPLLGACVQRLGRTNAPSSQRTAVLVRWVRTVLVIHSGHLMTVRRTLLIFVHVVNPPLLAWTDAGPRDATRWVARDADGAPLVEGVPPFSLRQTRHGTSASRAALIRRACTDGTPWQKGQGAGTRGRDTRDAALCGG